jgi:hypothetical protein
MTTETITLSRPLKTHDGEVTTLTLKEPTARAFVDFGEPFTLKPITDESGESNGVSFVFDNNKAFMRFLSNMTGVDDLLLSAMSGSDFQRIRVAAARIIVAGVQDKNFTEPSGA